MSTVDYNNSQLFYTNAKFLAVLRVVYCKKIYNASIENNNTQKENDCWSENLVEYKFENNFVELYQNNYVGRPNINNAAKNFDILAIILSILYNYFNNSIKFSEIFTVSITKILDSLTKLFLQYINHIFELDFLGSIRNILCIVN